jgi:uncharacterized membrane protein YsdA (DUF1294 family)
MTAPLADTLALIAQLYHAIGPANLVTGLIAINLIAFALFGIDKARAERGRWRISEGTLLGWALIGGTPGAYAGRALFRHKTRKPGFSRALHAIAGLQGLAALAGWWFWPG